MVFQIDVTVTNFLCDHRPDCFDLIKGVTGSHKKKKKIVPLIVGLVVGLSVSVGLMFIVWMKWKKNSTQKGEGK